jgi:hypothetical protein
MKKIIGYLSGTLIGAFALLTLFLSTSVILDLFGVRAKEGNYVLFVVWANFICSLIYLFSAYGFFTMKTWTSKTLALSVLILVLAIAGLFIHINAGGIYETKTVKALIFRISLSTVFTLIAYFSTKKLKNQ